VIEGTWIGIFDSVFFLGGSKQKPLGLGKIKHRWNAREMGVVVGDDEWMNGTGQAMPHTLLSQSLRNVEEGKQMRNEEERFFFLLRLLPSPTSLFGLFFFFLRHRSSFVDFSCLLTYLAYLRYQLTQPIIAQHESDEGGRWENGGDVLDYAFVSEASSAASSAGCAGPAGPATETEQED
jgi:hypothetical protein